jgi:TPR repeat protein
VLAGAAAHAQERPEAFELAGSEVEAVAGSGEIVELGSGFAWVEAGASRADLGMRALMGRMYEQGLGVAADLSEAKRLFEKAVAARFQGQEARQALTRLQGEP